VLWRLYCAGTGTDGSGLRFVSPKLAQCVADEDAMTLYRDLRAFWSLESTVCNVIRDGVESSSCDDDASQNINMTLDPTSDSFWSSKGSEDPDSSEYLIYRLH
jgi:hypothetical protein